MGPHQNKKLLHGKRKSVKIEREPTGWENIFANDTSDRVSSPKYIKNSHDSTPGRQSMQLKNGQKT